MPRPLIATKLSYIDENNSVEDVVNHMVKTINGTTTKAIASSISQTFNDSLPIGSIIHSMLTEIQFQSQLSARWVLMDGRNVAGSSYASLTGSSTVPDATGRFLRGKGANNPDGSLALGVYQSDTYASHAHQEQYASVGSLVPANTWQGGGGSFSTIVGTDTTQTDSGAPLLTVASGGNETRPRNITVNIFIKIN